MVTGGAELLQQPCLFAHRLAVSSTKFTKLLAANASAAKGNRNSSSSTSRSDATAATVSFALDDSVSMGTCSGEYWCKNG